jgi:hypothetical protein
MRVLTREVPDEIRDAILPVLVADGPVVSLEEGEDGKVFFEFENRDAIGVTQGRLRNVVSDENQKRASRLAR